MESGKRTPSAGDRREDESRGWELSQRLGHHTGRLRVGVVAANRHPARWIAVLLEEIHLRRMLAGVILLPALPSPPCLTWGCYAALDQLLIARPDDA